MKPITAVCKHCGKPAEVSAFKLDPVYKMVVCQNCIRDRQNAPRPKEKALGAVASTSLQKAPPMDTRVVYTCRKCQYPTKYDPKKGLPAICGYCKAPTRV